VSYSSLTTQIIEQFQLAKMQKEKEVAVSVPEFCALTSKGITPRWNPLKLLIHMFGIGSQVSFEESLSRADSAIKGYNALKKIYII